MGITVKITDKKQLEQINALRGEKTAEEFAAMCLQAGLRVAELQKQVVTTGGKGKQMKFSAAKPEFKTLDVAAITEALKGKDTKNPVKLEVNRLVSAYAAELRGFAKRNDNKLPGRLQLPAAAPIEKVAMEITAQAFKATAKKAKGGA